MTVTLSIVVLLVIVAAACGSSDSAAESSDDAAVSSDNTESSAPGDVLGSFRMDTISGPDPATSSFTTAAMGGVRLDYPDGWVPASQGERVSVRMVSGGSTVAVAEIMLVSQTTGGQQIATSEKFLSALSLGGVRHEPIEEELSLLGFTLSGHNIRALDLYKPFWLNRHPAPANGGHGVGEGTFNRSFLAETPSGVLWANAWGNDAATLTAAGKTLQLIAQSAEFTGPGLDPALPPGRSIQASIENPPPEPDTSEVADASLLIDPFWDPPAGSYALSNTGRNGIVDIDEETIVQPNFPGIVVLADDDNFAPGFDVLLFYTGVIEVIPFTGGPVYNEADAIGVSGFDDFLDNVPSGVKVTNVDRDLTIAGLRAASFEVSPSPDSDCSLEDPCVLSFATPYSALEIFEGMRNKLWWVEDYLGDQDLLVRAASPHPDTDWFDRSDAIMASMRFDN
ncbi:MAG: hypothetical protein ACN4GZ_17430 [Acidimicrobiales bacterium]